MSEDTHVEVDVHETPPAEEGDDQEAKEGTKDPTVTESDLEDADELDDDEDEDDE